MFSTEVWLTPIILLPGVALLTVSTANRFGQIQAEFHRLLDRPDSHAQIVARSLVTRARLDRDAMASLYASVGLFALGSLLGGVINLWRPESLWLVGGLTISGIAAIVSRRFNYFASRSSRCTSYESRAPPFGKPAEIMRAVPAELGCCRSDRPGRDPGDPDREPTPARRHGGSMARPESGRSIRLCVGPSLQRVSSRRASRPSGLTSRRSCARGRGLQTPTPRSASLANGISRQRLDEERQKVADLRARRRIDIAEAESEQNIFEMLDHLWNTRHTERLRFLRGEYDRDEVAEALARFDALGCELVTHEARMAKREVRYREEVFESTRELRGLDPATEDELVRAKFILTAARTRREHRSRRTRACKR